MLLALPLTYLWFSVEYAYHYYKDFKRKMRHIYMVNRYARQASIVFGNQVKCPTSKNKHSYSNLAQNTQNGWQEETLWSERHYKISALEPKLTVNLKDWTLFLDKQNDSLEHVQDSHLVLLEVYQPEDPEGFLSKSLSIPKGKRVKVSSIAVPLAWHPGCPFGLVAACSTNNLARLGMAFLDGFLTMDDMLVIHRIISVDVTGHPANLLTFDGQSKSSATPLSTSQGSLQSFLVDPNIPSTEPSLNGEDNQAYQSSNESLASASDDCLFDTGAGEGLHMDLEVEEEDGAEEEGCVDVGVAGGGEEPVSGYDEKTPFSSAANTPQHSSRQAKRRKSRNSTGKPPNVLVYCGKKDTARKFENIQRVLQQCLNPDSCVIYLLKHDQVHKTPWLENTALLIICCDRLYDDIGKVFLAYYQAGGKVISFGSMFDEYFVERVRAGPGIGGVLALQYKEWSNVTVICGNSVYRDCDSAVAGSMLRPLGRDKDSRLVMLKAQDENTSALAILSQANLDKNPVEMAISKDLFSLLKQSNPSRFLILRDLMEEAGMDTSHQDLPPLSPAYLLATSQNKKAALLNSVQRRVIDGVLKSRSVSLQFCEALPEVSDVISADKLPVITGVHAGKSVQGFNFDVYRANLKSEVLGNVIMFADVVNTTMTLFDGMMFSAPEDVGVIAIGNRQLSGKGRGGNAWLSPPGCAMFSLHVRISLSSPLGSKIGFLQHMVSLALVQAVTTLPGYQGLDLRLKWPNDIYFGRSLKLGGVIVNSTILKDTLHANIGCGVNVDNSDPTICVNDVIRQYNSEQQGGGGLAELATEEVIARTVTRLEQLIQEVQSHGIQAFTAPYYQRWLHSGSRVRLNDTSGPEATVQGLDENGYLSVLTESGQLVSVQPDGNSFDMTKNLIRMKSSAS